MSFQTHISGQRVKTVSDSFYRVAGAVSFQTHRRELGAARFAARGGEVGRVHNICARLRLAQIAGPSGPQTYTATLSVVFCQRERGVAASSRQYSSSTWQVTT